ncbi:hypothetical protein NQ318_001374, partial [Aromia moschata]
MEESFELQSSMSPKVKGHQKHFRKGTTLLALKKNIRRSSIYDKSVHTVNNGDLIIIEDSTTHSSSSVSSDIQAQTLNKTPIVISDTDCSENENDSEVVPSKQAVTVSKNVNVKICKESLSRKNDASLSNMKALDIERWIDRVNMETKLKPNATTYSELSTIYGDEVGAHFKPEGVGYAVNSTLVSPDCARFDGLFRSRKKSMKSEDARSGTSTKNSIQADVQEFVTILDDLYGDSWREKKDHVLPKTEPRRRLPKPSIPELNSERKPKLSVLHKNPYMESEKLKSSNLLQNLHRARLQINVESPWTQRLNNVCDSDSQSSSSNKSNPRKKLDFSESDNDTRLINERTSKYFRQNLRQSPPDNDSDKENSDHEFSYLGESLEERIKRKSIKQEIHQGGSNKKIPKKVTQQQPGPIKKSGPAKESDNLNGATSSRNNSTKNNTDLKCSGSSSSSVSSDDEWEKEIGKIRRQSKLINGKYSFLESLSANIPILQCDMSARIYRNNFKQYKDQLLKVLFNLYNENIFDNAIPKETEFQWNERMRGTAGYCVCRKITRRTGVVERNVRIVLSTKVIDEAYRLRDTLLHELCHAATWIVNCVSDGHGQYWKAWAYKAMKTFPELPPIKRCHDYVVNTKYTYKCTGCGYSIGRHSKSLDVERKRCGYCRGKFEILLNK